MCYTRRHVVRGSCTPLIQLRTSVGYRRHVSCTPLMSVCWYKLRPCATHVRVLCTLLIQATHDRRRPCVGQSCEPLIQATSPSVLFTTVTSYTRSRNFLIHFLNYIRDVHILQASFSICACDLNKTDQLRELAMTTVLTKALHWHYNIIYIKKVNEKNNIYWRMKTYFGLQTKYSKIWNVDNRKHV